MSSCYISRRKCKSMGIFHFPLIFLKLVIFVESESVFNPVTPWTVTHQGPLSMEFSMEEYWSG